MTVTVTTRAVHRKHLYTGNHIQSACNAGGGIHNTKEGCT